ncbi:uncharacterized protein LOC119586003 [Penaeus monodon]|uniref:uncharacterized protein LOC119586003 n=1 Tax=Penaeus monodon TaxID=6687 RepID=UPI0018A6EA00|nr:uncharacterized protein LOC119586003 [Penaeus monodon]
MEVVNDGGEIVAQELQLFVSPLGSYLSSQDLADLTPAFSGELEVGDLPTTGTAKEVDVSSASVPGSMETCGQYFLVAAIRDKGTTNRPAQGSVSLEKECEEDIDLKWFLEPNEEEGTPDMYMAPGSNVVAKGGILSILNVGNGNLALRSAVDTPEIAAYLGPRSWDWDLHYKFQYRNGSTLQEVMESTLASHREYFDVYNVEDFIQLKGWSTILVDVNAATSIDLPSGGNLEMDLEMLEAPKNIPCIDEIGLLVLVIDPQNKTKDSNMTNNVAVLPVGLSCQSNSLDPSFDTPNCLVIPNLNHDGRSATMIMKRFGDTEAYEFKTRKGREGFRKMRTDEIREEIEQYDMASVRMERLKALGRCPQESDVEEATEDPWAQDLLNVVTSLKDGLDELTMTSEDVAADHEKIQTLLGLVKDILTLTLEEDGPVRHVFMSFINHLPDLFVKDIAMLMGPQKACMIGQAALLESVGGPAAELAKEMMEINSMERPRRWSPPREGACRPGRPRCGDGTCLRKNSICDGRVDCGNGEDEDQRICATFKRGSFDPSCALNCTNMNGDKVCIPAIWLCDGMADCADSLDEDALLCPFNSECLRR